MLSDNLNTNWPKSFYPHMPIGKVWIYQLLFVVFFCNCVCVFVHIWISRPRIKLTASNFARWFIGILGRESHSHILGKCAKSAGESASAPTEL